MRVLLGVAGGIAAYKTPELVRLLRAQGAEVRCILTANGGRLVAAAALAAVSGAPVHSDLWSGDGHGMPHSGHDGTMPHIDLARWAERMVIAPATADVVARMALGLADDLLTTVVLALEPAVPVFFAPAMNTQMWNKVIVQTHVHSLSAAGMHIIAPVSGHLACGEQGVGAMADPAAIAAAVLGK